MIQNKRNLYLYWCLKLKFKHHVPALEHLVYGYAMNQILGWEQKSMMTQKTCHDVFSSYNKSVLILGVFPQVKVMISKNYFIPPVIGIFYRGAWLPRKFWKDDMVCNDIAALRYTVYVLCGCFIKDRCESCFVLHCLKTFMVMLQPKIKNATSSNIWQWARLSQLLLLPAFGMNCHLTFARPPPSLVSFKEPLKTFLFCQAFLNLPT